MMINSRTETWTLPTGRAAVIEVEEHHDGSSVVPVMYELFAQMAADLGFVKEDDE